VPEYVVNLQTVASLSIKVEAASPEEAVDEAYQYVPQLSAHDAGMFNDTWSREEGQYEAFSVYDAANTAEVWSSGEQWVVRPVEDHPGA
jgi:hypothetical protein